MTADALDKAKWYAIVSRGAFAFRFGPFDGPTIGKIMTQCLAENIPLLVTGDMGPEFDWQVARDMRGISSEVFPDLIDGIRSLLNGIDTGLVTLDTVADETLANTMAKLRRALAEAEGSA